MKALISTLILFGAIAASAAELPSVDLTKFPLKTKKGEAHVFPTDKVVVLVVTEPQCPIVRKYMPRVDSLARDFSGKVDFVLLNASAHETNLTPEEAKLSDIVPELMDDEQKLARAIGFRTTSQSAVIRNGKVVYRGAIDDGESYDGSRGPQNQHLKNAIEAALKGEEPKVREARAFGCSITYKN